MDAEMEASPGTLLPRGVIDPVGKTAASKRKERVLPIADLPKYGEVEENGDGNAVLPCDFMPGLLEKLPHDCYYRTYQWYKYFDKTQRDQSGEIRVPSELTTENPTNVAKWKEVAKKIFVVDFKEEGKYRYGVEIGQMADIDGWRCGGWMAGGRRPRHLLLR